MKKICNFNMGNYKAIKVFFILIFSILFINSALAIQEKTYYICAGDSELDILCPMTTQTIETPVQQVQLPINHSARNLGMATFIILIFFISGSGFTAYKLAKRFKKKHEK